MLIRPSHRAQVKPLGAFVDGRFQSPPPDRHLERRSPSDPDDLVGVFPVSDAAVDAAVDAAARAARLFGQLPTAARLAALRALAAPLGAQAHPLSLCMQRELGRPPWETQREAQALARRLAHVLEHAPAQLEARAWPGGARVVSRPLGVVAVLGPAMLPLAHAHTQILAALAAGNSVVFKPSEECPATAQLYAEVLGAAGLPPGLFNLVQGDSAIGRRLVEHPAVDAVVCFGRDATTRAVAESCVASGKRAIVHPGCRNAAVVLADADLLLAAYEVTASAFLSAGQRCTAIARVYVDAAVLAPFAELVTRLVASLRVGPPAARVFMGPLLSADRLERFCAARATVDADVLVPGERLDRAGYFVAASVRLARGESDGAPVELFGPDLTLVETAGLDQALPRLGAVGYASLFSASESSWQRFTEAARGGMLLRNRGTTTLSGALPAGVATRSGGDAILALRREVTLDARPLGEPEIFPGTIDALAEERS